AINFYHALKDKRYVEGFRLSVYRGAVEGLSAAELKELEPDFARAFSAIPGKIEAKGEQVMGDAATVYLQFEGQEKPQPVALIRVQGEWLVGDQESLALVQLQGRNFFFNTRMQVNEEEAGELLQRLVWAELLYAQNKGGVFATLQELIQLDGAPKELAEGTVGGYAYTMTVAADKSSFFITATPAQYGKTGKLSFYADNKGVRAEDAKGKAATANSPLYNPR
ncbi:MAG TPA: hypothetical protein VNO70_14985, partial [Blastocatellia bacterium]|nr:hypothetical protein [Blastocatellia bacterium]